MISQIAELPLEIDMALKQSSIHEKARAQSQLDSVAHRGTNYTTTFRDSLGMMSGSPSERESLTLSVLERDMQITNYQNALEWGKTAIQFDHPVAYHKTRRNPFIHYETLRPGPVVLKEAPILASKADLPLVSGPGSIASSRQWDKKGTIEISKF